MVCMVQAERLIFLDVKYTVLQHHFLLSVHYWVNVRAFHLQAEVDIGIAKMLEIDPSEGESSSFEQPK